MFLVRNTTSAYSKTPILLTNVVKPMFLLGYPHDNVQATHRLRDSITQTGNGDGACSTPRTVIFSEEEGLMQVNEFTVDFCELKISKH